MTRKRKNVQSDEGGQEEKRSDFGGYGYEEQGQYEEEQPKGFPSKKFQSDNEYGEKRSYQNRNYPSSEDIARYERSQNGEDGQTRGEFPKDVVGYLRSIEQVKKAEGKIEEFILDKCAQEVVGVETTLLEWTEACVVVESVFGSCAYGASLFLTALSRLKHKKLIDLFFAGAAARTIENLIFVLVPVANEDNVELIGKFSSLLCDNWNDVVVDKSASFLLRALLRVLSGLGPKQIHKGPPHLAKTSEKPKFVNNEIKDQLKREYSKIAALAFDSQLNANYLDHATCSLVVQDAIDMDLLWKGKRTDEFVKKIVMSDNGGDAVVTGWQGKNSSRLWEKAMTNCGEETRQQVWMAAVEGKVQELALHPSANFALQKLISGVTSLELATDVLEETAPLVTELLVSRRDGVVRAIVLCASRHEDLQEKILKQLRTHFRANKASNKTHFLFNVLTGNKFDGETFVVDNCSLGGSLLVEDLLKLDKIKTLSACFEALTDEQIRTMATHKVASHVVQSALNSQKLGEEVKKKIMDAFEEHWEEIISDMYGSHVFEKVWTVVDVRRKQEILKKLVPIRNTSKFWKFAMLRCDLQLFRNDRKKWVDKMKQMSKE